MTLQQIQAILKEWVDHNRKERAVLAFFIDYEAKEAVAATNGRSTYMVATIAAAITEDRTGKLEDIMRRALKVVQHAREIGAEVASNETTEK